MAQDRVQWVDALRAFAALGVAWFHLYTDQSPHIPLPEFVTHFAVLGRWGVELFFAISGFVLAFTLLPRSDMTGPGDVALYMARRSVRLDITFWVVVALYVVAQPLLSSRDYAPGFSWSQLATSILYFLPGDIFGAPGNYIPTAWTLAIEVQFYAFFATLVVVLNLAVRAGAPRDRATFIAIALMVAATVPSVMG